MPRRTKGTILPLEAEILAAGMQLQSRDGEFYGFLLAKEMSEGRPQSPLIAHGTLYKALGRMVGLGLLESSWEAPEDAEQQGRPRRRLYRVTGEGERALTESRMGLPTAALGAARVRPA